MRGLTRGTKANISAIMLAIKVAGFSFSSFFMHSEAFADVKVLHDKDKKEGIPVTNFFRDLYNRNHEKIVEKFLPIYNETIERGLDKTADRELFMKSYFLYLMVRNCGFLGDMWDKYSTPSPNNILEATLVKRTEEPMSDNCHGYVLARCDRLEMLFKALLKEVFDIDSNIHLVSSNPPIQRLGDHTNTEIRIGDSYVRFDNSFGHVYVSKNPTCDLPPSDGGYNIKNKNRGYKIKPNLTITPGIIQKIEQAFSIYIVI